MKLDFNLQVKQRQGLALTAQVQQAIKLLHMTNIEIQEFVSDQFQDNPFIATNSLKEKATNQDTSKETLKDIDRTFQDDPYRKQDTESKISIENQFETGEGYIPKSTVSNMDSDFDIVSIIKANDKSLYTHCVDYVNTLTLSSVERLVALKLK